MTEIISSWLYETLLATSILVVIILLIRKPVARYFGPAAAYLLWIAPVLRLVLPEFSVLPAVEQGLAAEYETFSASGVSQTTPLTSLAAGPAVSLSAIFLLIWLIGIGINLYRHLQSHWYFYQSVSRNSHTASASLIREFEIVKQKICITNNTNIIVSNKKDGPFVIGFIRPKIIVPYNFEAIYTPVERSLALTHECNHIKRGDMAALMMAIIFKSIFWLNPLTYFAFSAFRTDQEAACDEAVLHQNRHSSLHTKAYANAILKAVTIKSGLPVTSLAMSHPIKERISLMTNRNSATHPLARIFAIVLIFCGLATTANYSQASAEQSNIDIEKTDDGKGTSHRRSIITTDSDNEELRIDGFDGNPLRKIIYTDKNGRRTLKAYNKKGKKVLDEKYLPDTLMPYDGVRTFEDGEEKSFLSFTQNGGFKISELSHPPHPHHPPAHPHPGKVFIDCSTESGTQEFIWKSDDGEKVIVKEFDCRDDESIGGIDENASPEQKANAIRVSIEALEREAARSNARREKAINKLKERLREIEEGN